MNTTEGNGYHARVIADSLSPEGKRLTSMVVTFPRSVLSEFNTHREFSRNSASSRAIPVMKQIKKIMDSPFIPTQVGRNKPGMQAGERLEGTQLAHFQRDVLIQRDRAVIGVFELLLGSGPVRDALGEDYQNSLVNGFRNPSETVDRLVQVYEEGMRSAEADKYPNVHKETVNRYLEPFMWHTVIVSATEWSNFYALRCHEAADPKIQTIAMMMRDAMNTSTPEPLSYNQWHAPFLSPEERNALNAGDDQLLDVAVGRCARVSYLTHGGDSDPQKDMALTERLRSAGHMSPFEHVATPGNDLPHSYSNFKGWTQLRKTIPNENDYSQVTNEQA